MIDDETDRLTQQLERVHLQREEALHIVKRSEDTERDLITRTQTARWNNPSSRRNPLRVVDIVQITNTLRDEHGIIGVVESSPARLAIIRNTTTKQTYTRG